jgi:hypothetical protein
MLRGKSIQQMAPGTIENRLIFDKEIDGMP